VVTEARHGADHALRDAVVRDQLARGEHGLRKLVVGDVVALPHLLDQFVAPDRTLAMLEQILEAIEHAPRDVDLGGALQQLARRRPQAELTESIVACAHGRPDHGVGRGY
jgi:hypothetical protein